LPPIEVADDAMLARRRGRGNDPQDGAAAAVCPRSAARDRVRRMIVFSLLGLVMPRFIMVVLWLFTDYLSRAYDGWLLPLIGFFVLPTTTLAYAIAENSMHGARGFGLVLIVLGVLVDVGVIGSRGRGVFRKKS
jgi:hypothetical protein